MRMIRGKKLKSLAEFIFDGCKYKVNKHYVGLPVCELYANDDRIFEPQFFAAGVRYYAVAHTRVTLPPDVVLLLAAAPTWRSIDLSQVFFAPDTSPFQIGAYFSVTRTQRIGENMFPFAAYLFDVGPGDDTLEATRAVGASSMEAVA